MSQLRLSVITLTLAAAVGGSPAVASDAAPAPDPWVSVTPEGYYRFTLPHAVVREIVGAEPVVVELQGNIGPAGTWSDLAADLNGSAFETTVGPLEPGLYYYQYTATLMDRTKVSFKEPTSPRAVTSEQHWNTLFVPGESVQWMSDVPDGGTLAELELVSPVTGEPREALVWTPPGYDADRPEAYPALYILAGKGQSAPEWAELGRVPQILDNLAAEGELADMVVVMADANLEDPRREVIEGILPATRRAFHVSTDGAANAVAGVADGASQALGLLANEPGSFAAVGALSVSDREALGAALDDVTAGDAAVAAAINEATSLVRLYVGNVLDPAYNETHAALETLAAAGIDHEFDGVTPGSGGTWETWRGAMRDFASRVFRAEADGAPRAGHLPLDSPYAPPAEGSISTPHVDANGIVTFETGTQWAEAKDVTVWGNWAPNGAWFRIPMAKNGERWRVSLGPLDGFYYYRYVVDGVDHKDPADTVNTLTGVSPLFVPGETDRLLGDVPEGQGGQLEILAYESSVAPGDRSAYVWTPPGYDPERTEPYPVLYLNHGGDQSWGDWVEVGRARQIFDNLTADGAVVPMVVVMGDGNVQDFPAELLENLVPAAEGQFHIDSRPSRRALAGLSMGAMHTLNTWLTHPGEFGYIGAFSGFLFSTPPIDAEAVNAGTILARIYTGDGADFTHDNTMGLMATLDDAGVDYEFPGVTPGPHGFDTWQTNLIDLAPLLFREELAADDGGSGGTESPAVDDDAPPATESARTFDWRLAGLIALGVAVVAGGVVVAVRASRRARD